MEIDVTKLTQGQLIRLCDDLGMSKEEIAHWVTVRESLLVAKDTVSSIEKTLNDPVVKRANAIIQEDRQRKQKRERLVGYVLGASFWGFMFWLIFMRPFT